VPVTRCEGSNHAKSSHKERNYGGSNHKGSDTLDKVTGTKDQLQQPDRKKFSTKLSLRKEQ